MYVTCISWEDKTSSDEDPEQKIKKLNIISTLFIMLFGFG